MISNQIQELVERAIIEEPISLIAIDLASFLAKELPPRELILTPWLPKSGLCMIHAFRGIGKTHVALGIACAVAKGSKFLGWEAPKPRHVLYIDGEMPASVLQERLAQIVVMMGDNNFTDQIKIITPDLQNIVMPDLATKEGQALINYHITDEIDLIIVDNLSCLAPSIKENDASDWTTIQTWVLSLRARGKSVLLVHHSGKAGSQRGTSKKEDVLDTVITLKRPKYYDTSEGARFIVEFEKSRGFLGEDAKSFEAQLSCNESGILCWTTKPIEDTTYQKVVMMLNNGMTQKDIARSLSINKSGVSRYTKQAKIEGLYNSKKKISSE